MPNAALTKDKLDNLADYIEPRDPATASHLRELGSGLIGGPSAEAWAFSNIRAVLDPDRISNALVGDSSTDIVTRGLEFLRNSLVLLPLAITWFGIALAVDAYYKLLGARPDLGGQSFIYLWQSGFQGRMPLPLGTLAIIDAVLLAGVFGLTLLAYARSAWLSMVSMRFGTGFIRLLNEALGEAELVLAPLRGAQYYAAIQNTERNARELLVEIADERGRVARLAQQREHELGDLNGITENLKNSSIVFLNAAQSMANTHTATLAALNGVAGTVKGLAIAQQEVIKAMQNVAGRIDGSIPQRAPDSSGSFISRIEAGTGRPESMSGGQPLGDVSLMIQQQRELQDALRKIESLIAAQQQGMEKMRADRSEGAQRSEGAHRPIGKP